MEEGVVHKVNEKDIYDAGLISSLTPIFCRFKQETAPNLLQNFLCIKNFRT